ncbi:Alpha-(1,3)-fucosyltransferase C [Eumeta japonica]|uniref:Fucosyltransferase n=1 Tax=Eumeta variegata TaxID=151549 RepID=A0A4C1Y829_EUMVA|nr:Alpha-(1,3)-fucosyltransferase C [Eumeta japonica]
MRVRLRGVLILCACLCIPLAVNWLEWHRPVRLTHAPPPPAAPNSTKLILSWVSYFGDPYFGFGAGKRAFVQHGCPVADCEITDDRLRVPQHHFDALLFHGFEYYEILFGKPRHRSPHQRYVFMTLESALHTPIPEHFRYFYNVTLTYRLDSDIPWPYFVVRDRVSGVRVAPGARVRWRKPRPVPLNRTDWRRTLQRVRLKAQPARAAWFVSNCHSESGREGFASELGKYMPVDVYGGCGRHECPSAKYSNCSQLLSERYHFYLAFENSLCEDYLTEKVLHALLADTVPVVLSGVRLTRFLPPRSYVNARGASPAELAAQLTRLAAEPERFASYFWWRDYYRIERTIPGERQEPGVHPLCTLCALLHAPTPSEVRDHDTIVWWKGNDSDPRCIELG